MGVKMSGQTLSSTSVELTHGPSGTVVKTTAPKDNGGDGSCFSPTDLCAASLGACAATIMAMAAKNHGIEAHIAFDVEKHMQAAPRKIERIAIEYRISADCSDAQFEKIVQAGRTCPVRLTLGEGVVLEENFVRKSKGNGFPV